MATTIANESDKTVYIVRLPKTEDPDSIQENEFRACMNKASRVKSLAEFLYEKM